MKRGVCVIMALFFLVGVLSVSAFAHTEADPFVTDLIAGQHIDAGDVLVWNDDDNLYVKYLITDPDWCLTEYHLHVANDPNDIPQTKKNNPIPGKFDYKKEFESCVSETDIIEIPLEWESSDVYVAAHAALSAVETMTIASEEGDIVYGPVYEEPNEFTDWGSGQGAVRAYNWLGAERPEDQINDCTNNPYSSESWSWGFGNDFNPTYDPDIEGVIWISTANNTEIWAVDSWRKFVVPYEVPETPVAASIQVNADNYYYVISNGLTIGSNGDIFDGPESYDLFPVEGMNTLEFIVRNIGQGPADNACEQVGNPNGLAYKAQISYLTGEDESAWAAGFDFDGKNWATYFIYPNDSEI